MSPPATTAATPPSSRPPSSCGCDKRGLTLAIDLVGRERGCRIGGRVIRILVRLIRDDPLRIAIRRHGYVGMANRVVAGFDPPRTVAIVADCSLATEADQIDLGVPLPIPLANRAFRIEGPVSRLKRDDVESMGAVWSVAINDVAGMGDRSSPTLRPNDSSKTGFPPSCRSASRYVVPALSSSGFTSPPSLRMKLILPCVSRIAQAT